MLPMGVTQLFEHYDAVSATLLFFFWDDGF